MTVKKFQTERGDVPFDDWMDRIDTRVQARVAKRLDRIERGNFGDHKSVGQGVMESGLTMAQGTASISVATAARP